MATSHPLLKAWIDEMARYARQNDPYRHLVTCSLGSATVWPDLWSLPSMDVIQYHEYGHADLPSRPLPTLPGLARAFHAKIRGKGM